MGRLAGAEAWVQQAPNISLLVNGQEVAHSGIQAFAQGQHTRPAVFDAHIVLRQLPKGNMDSTLAVHFEGIPDRRVPLTAVVRDAQPHEEMTGPPKVYTFVSMNGFPPEYGTRMTKLHCEWCVVETWGTTFTTNNQNRHQRQGFTGTLLYVTPHFLSAMTAQPQVQQLVNSGYLTVVRWDYFPDFIANSGPRYVQV
jgi:hypothetical protein